MKAFHNDSSIETELMSKKTYLIFCFISALIIFIPDEFLVSFWWFLAFVGCAFSYYFVLYSALVWFATDDEDEKEVTG